MANRYPMGNSGDLIKHGLLAEFVEWWSEKHEGQTLRVADTFAGRPCRAYCRDGRLDNRLSALGDCALKRAYPKGGGKYFGSSHLVRRVAESRRLALNIDMSDKCDNVRRLLDDSIAEHKNSMRLISSLKGNDGYEILEKENWKCDRDYNLILIDPYRDPDCVQNLAFNRIYGLVQKHAELYVAFFLLYENENECKGKFDGFKSGKLSPYALSLHCPKTYDKKTKKAADKIESKYRSEILLISEQIADGNCGGLCVRLSDFADKATHALREVGELLSSKGDKVEFWSPPC